MKAHQVQRITILGSTGSVGQNALSVLSKNTDRYQIYALTAYKNVERMFKQCLEFQPEKAVMVDAQAAQQLRTRLEVSGIATQVEEGRDALEAIAAKPVDIVLAAIVGGAGLVPTLQAVKTSKRILLANKEALVMAGPVFMNAVKESGATLIPVDSEHNALLQCMPPNYRVGELASGVESVVLTASGGPFRDRPLEHFSTITPEEAVTHPNWSMGAKISVDSATMMNKGLEVIEAHYLFQLTPEAIQVVIHPQSIVHSCVNYTDGSMLAQLGQHDMRTPIAAALAWPERIPSGVARLNLLELQRLDFSPIFTERFPCLSLAYRALNAGPSAITVLNAANEVAVEAFLAGELPFMSISEVVEAALDRHAVVALETLNDVLEIDREVRVFTAEKLEKLGKVCA